MSDFYATSTNNAVEIGKDVYPYRDTELLKKLVSRESVSITAEDLYGITRIGSCAFYSFTLLVSIFIPDSVTSIEPYAFYNCSSLTNITIPNNVTIIKSNSFYYCTGLTSATIGNNVTSIGPNSFDGCTHLTNITCLAVTPPTIQSNTFGTVPATCIIKVPAQSVEAYKSATNWSARANYIQAI